MQFPDRQPEEEQDNQLAPESDLEAASFQPLYEFPPAPFLPESERKPASTSETTASPVPSSASAEIISPPYPPHPSYYQNMVEPSNQTALTSQQPAHSVPPSQGPGPAVTMPPFVPAMALQPPAKRSRKWLWIVLAILAVVLIGSCSLCSWAAYAFFNTTYQQVSGSLKVVDDFYSNIQAQNYAAAYSDLAPQDFSSSLTQDQFLQQAQARDTHYGSVLSFTPNQPSYTINPNTNQPDLSHLTITVQVKRTHLNYTALVSVRNINGNWKITSFDVI